MTSSLGLPLNCKAKYKSQTKCQISYYIALKFTKLKLVILETVKSVYSNSRYYFQYLLNPSSCDCERYCPVTE